MPFRPSRGFGVAIVLSIVAMMVVWAPMMALADSGNSQAPADPPGLSEEPPGNSAEAPGQVAKSETTTTVTEAPPGNSATAPGQTKTDTPPAPPAGSNAGGNAGNSTSSGGSSDKSTPSTSNKGGNGNNVPADNLNDGVGGGVGNSENQDKDRPNVGNGEGKGQIPADDCTNKHQGADGNKGGANQNPGPYDNTCDGRPSENGQGGGNAKGRPCQGCVGNADDKNPPGQFPNGASDGNKGNGKGNGKNRGYECDDNNGVGKGNPAHTGCEPVVNNDCTSWTLGVTVSNGSVTSLSSGTLVNGTATYSSNPGSVTVNAARIDANHSPPSQSATVTGWSSTVCNRSTSFTFTPNGSDCSTWTVNATVSGGTITSPSDLTDGTQVYSSNQNGLSVTAAPDGNHLGPNQTQTVSGLSATNCHASVGFNFTPRQDCVTDCEPPPLVDCDNDGIDDNVDADISTCEPPPEGEDCDGDGIPDDVDTDLSACDPDELPEFCPDGVTPMPEDGVCDEVLGEIIDKDPKPGLPEVAGEVLGKAEEPQAAVLPFTGGSVLPLLIVSLTMLGAGGATLYRRREASEGGVAA